MRAVVTFHSIDDSGSPISVRLEEFDRHVAWLASGRVRPRSVSGILTAEDDAEDAVAVTFDDGYENFRTHAWPRLREAGIPVTLAVVSGYAGRRNDWEAPGTRAVPRIPLLDWDTLASLVEDGVEIAAHGRTHRPLPSLEDAELEEELARSAEEIQARTGARPSGFVYPYGWVDARCPEAASRHYEWACTTEARVLRAREHRFLIPRLDAVHYRRPGRLEAWGSPAFRTHLALRRLARSAGSSVRRVSARRMVRR
ncbi:MAG: polysaccharide deacetylase family protein [Gemmatimonadota bacterium]